MGRGVSEQFDCVQCVRHRGRRLLMRVTRFRFQVRDSPAASTALAILTCVDRFASLVSVYRFSVNILVAGAELAFLDTD